MPIDDARRRLPFIPRCRPPAHLFTAGLLGMLSACGGGGDDTSSAPPIPGTPSGPAAITASGNVFIDQGIGKALVCADLNANQACDAGEPVSPATGADGSYSLTYQPADEASASAFRSAALVATIGADAVDAAEPGSTATQRAFVLMAPAGKASRISPLTTLVQKAVAQGQSLADAEAAVAQQLDISVARIYDYQGDTPSSTAVLPDTARTVAKMMASALELGAATSTVPVGAAATASTTLGSLNYTDAQNYRLAVRESDGVVDANGYTQQFERRSGQAAGTALTTAQLYPTPASVTLTDKGWNRCDGTLPRQNTRGTPSRTKLCDGATRFYSVSVAEEDLSGRSMAAVAAQLQAGDSRLNAEGVAQTTTLTLASAAVLGNAIFPSGSQLRTSVTAQLNRPITINNTATDAVGGGVATLGALATARPASAVHMATAAGTLPLGLVDNTHTLRAAFIDGSTLQLYRCDATAPNYTDSNNCAAFAQSAYAIDTVGGVNLLRLAAFPATTLDQVRGYAEYNGGVYQYRQQRPPTDEGQVLSYVQRLNGTAWTALKAQLGL